MARLLHPFTARIAPSQNRVGVGQCCCVFTMGLEPDILGVDQLAFRQLDNTFRSYFLGCRGESSTSQRERLPSRSVQRRWHYDLCMSVESAEDLRGVRTAGRVVAETIETMRSAVRVGVTTAQLDRVAADYFKKVGARSAPQAALSTWCGRHVLLLEVERPRSFSRHTSPRPIRRRPALGARGGAPTPISGGAEKKSALATCLKPC